jgi:FKBP-type peptidyl-prolyl cis-trans isomerase FkpA
MFDKKSGNLKKITSLLCLLLATVAAQAQQKDLTTQYTLPDSVKAVSLIATIQSPQEAGNIKWLTGIGANQVFLSLQRKKNRYQCHFGFPKTAETAARGLDVTLADSKRMIWKFDGERETYYKLFIASAADSAENFTLYSGYIYFPAQNKWKLLGTCRMNGEWTSLKKFSSFTAAPGKSVKTAPVINVWYQQRNGSWKIVQSADTIPPVLPPFSSMDSARQFTLDAAKMEKDIAAGSTDVKPYKEGIYYAMLKEGNGKQVAVTDTVTVFYKGYLYADGKVFDQTKDKPARFPLSRLIKGWQLGLQLCKVGGKIKLVILSGQSYAIRTRAAKIPPNSILVFEIEVVDAKAPQ